METGHYKSTDHMRQNIHSDSQISRETFQHWRKGEASEKGTGELTFLDGVCGHIKFQIFKKQYCKIEEIG